MVKRMRVLLMRRAYWASVGLLWISACGVSDIQLRDFALSISVRTFFQTLGTALQAAIVESFGS